VTFRLRLGAVVACVLLAVTGASRATAQGDPPLSTTPAGFTPWLLSSTPQQYVRQLVQCGPTMYAVGTISAVGQGSSTYRRGNGFSFSATTGAMTSWDPRTDGMIRSIALSPDCSTAYLAGTFGKVHGHSAANIVAVDTATGAVRTEFARDASSEVDALVYHGRQLLVGGTFTTINGASRTRLASLNPTTGQVTPYANLSITGTYPNSRTRIYKMQVSHAGDRMLVEGVFRSIQGESRRQVAMLNLDGPRVTVNAWHAGELDRPCAVRFYARSAAWSPNDRRVYVATTGYLPAYGPGAKPTEPRSGLCDAAIAFPARARVVDKIWINYTGCDSLYAIAADSRNVYIAGHERWADNRLGCDRAGTGAVDRPGIGSLNPVTGAVTDWDPTRARGYGAVDLVLTEQGLWVASDNFSDGMSQKCGGIDNHGGICLFPR